MVLTTARYKVIERGIFLQSWFDIGILLSYMQRRLFSPAIPSFCSL